MGTIHWQAFVLSRKGVSNSTTCTVPHTTTPLSCCSMFVHVMVLVYHDIPVSMVQDRGLFLKRSAWGVASQSAGAGQAVCLPDAAPREWHGLDAWLAEEGKWI